MKVLKYGNIYFINCAVTLPWYYTVQKSRQICKEIKNAISEKFDSRVKLNIHVAPCNSQNCPECLIAECHVRKNSFVRLNTFSLMSITRDKDYI